MPEIIAANIDRLCSVEMRHRASPGGLPRGVLTQLYDALRATTDAPLSLLGARGLLERIQPEDYVLILCGSGTPPYLPFGETDGPLGGAAIARALRLGLGARPVLVAEQHLVPPIVASVEAAGLVVTDDPGDFDVRPATAIVTAFPYGMDHELEVLEVFDRFEPSAVIFVERMAPNAAGIYHTLRGSRVDPSLLLANHIFAAVAQERGILTIGIGDGGNEIGFGCIRDHVREILPAGKRCTCPCGEGVASVVSTDVVISAMTANLGAYGLTAMLSYLLGKHSLLHAPETETRMLAACVAAGAADGATSFRTLSVDGMSMNAQLALLALLHEIIDNGQAALGEVQ